MEAKNLNFEGMEILDFLKGPSIKLNACKSSLWGVAFKDESIICASAYSLVRIDGLKTNMKDGFYSYLKDNLTDYGYPLKVEDLEYQLSSFRFEGVTVFPLTNMINRLGLFTSDDLLKCRVVFTPTFLEENMMPMKFNEISGDKIFKLDGLKPFTVSGDSYVPKDLVKPDMPYICTVDKEDSECYHANVLSPYGKVRMGINFSPKIFKPERIEELDRLIDVPQDCIVCSNIINSTIDKNVCPLGMPVIHVDATKLDLMLKIMLFTGCEDVEVHFGNHSNHPIMIRNAPKSDKDIIVTIFLQPLNLDYGIQER